MSKSLGNFFLVKDILLHFQPMVLRFFILSTHYRSPLDFSDERLTESEKALNRLVSSVHTAKQLLTQTPRQNSSEPSEELAEAVHAARTEYEAAMADDFNTALAISSMFALAKVINSACQVALRGEAQLDSEGLRKAIDELVNMMEDLGISLEEKPDNVGQDEALVANLMDILLELRRSARESKDWATADSIRNSLQAAGIVVEDSPQGARWKRG
jgi:cysteinyl-tRNA synthetase